MQRSRVTAVAKEHCAGPLPLHSLCSLLFSWQWPSARIQLLVQAVVVLSSLKVDTDCTLVTKNISFPLQAGALLQTDWCQYCSISFVSEQLTFRRMCLRDGQILMSCYGLVFWSLYWNGNTIGTKILQYWSRLWNLCLGEAQTWLGRGLGISKEPSQSTRFCDNPHINKNKI